MFIVLFRPPASVWTSSIAPERTMNSPETLLRLNDDLPRRGAARLGLKAVQHRTDLLRRQAVKKGEVCKSFSCCLLSMLNMRVSF